MTNDFLFGPGFFATGARSEIGVLVIQLLGY